MIVPGGYVVRYQPEGPTRNRGQGALIPAPYWKRRLARWCCSRWSASSQISDGVSTTPERWREIANRWQRTTTHRCCTGSKKAHVGASDCARARRTLPVSLRRMKREDRAVALLATTAAQAGDYSYAVSRYNSVVGALARPHSADVAVECALHVADGNVRFMNGSPSLRRRRSMVLCI